jgi:hypothetical protein
MTNDPANKRDTSDKLTSATGESHDASTTEWLIRQVVATVHELNGEGSAGHQHLIELLRSRADLVDEARQMYDRLGKDSMFRWSLLYAFSDIVDESAAEFLTAIALSPLPEQDPKHCQSVRDTETLVRTMAIEALRRLATRVPGVGKSLLHIVSAQPARPLLAEAVKACRSLGLSDEVKSMLSRDSYWMLELRQADRGELVAPVDSKSDVQTRSSPPHRPFRTSKPRVDDSCR